MSLVYVQHFAMSGNRSSSRWCPSLRPWGGTAAPSSGSSRDSSGTTRAAGKGGTGGQLSYRPEVTRILSVRSGHLKFEILEGTTINLFFSPKVGLHMLKVLFPMLKLPLNISPMLQDF